MARRAITFAAISVIIFAPEADVAASHPPSS
jgi:hypothetical protein